jgi:hypothetical protein
MTCDNNVVFTCDGTVLVSLEANVEEHGAPIGGSVVCSDTSGTARIRLDAASQQFGGVSILVREGGIQLVNGQGKIRATIADGDPLANQGGGIIALTASTDTPTATSWGGPATAIVLNASERALTISAGDGTPIVKLSALGQNAIEIRDAEGQRIFACRTGNAALYLGAQGNEGDLVVVDGKGVERIHLNAGDGQVFLRNPAGEDRLELNGRQGSIIVRGPDTSDRINLVGATAVIEIKSTDQQEVIRLSGIDAEIRVGGMGHAGSITLFDSSWTPTLTLDGGKGDILLQNADCAEEFDLAPGVEIEPATVLVIDERGLLTPSTRPYDHAVAGVASGGGGERPGIVFGHRPAAGRRLPIALVGRVQCRVDADSAPIAVGDLLTTSATPGHGMKATDPSRAFGAVLGKALAPLGAGRGTIPILVGLQ